MKGYYVKERTLARGKKVSMGIDVHKESWQVTAISEGEEIFQAKSEGLPFCYLVNSRRSHASPEAFLTGLKTESDRNLLTSRKLREPDFSTAAPTGWIFQSPGLMSTSAPILGQRWTFTPGCDAIRRLLNNLAVGWIEGETWSIHPLSVSSTRAASSTCSTAVLRADSRPQETSRLRNSDCELAGF